MTPAQILAIVGAVGKVLDAIGSVITPELVQKVMKYFAETGNMPSEEKILEMHGDIHPPEWYDRTTLHGMQPPKPVPVVTYKIVGDRDDQLKIAAKLSCNFWNHFITPSGSIVVRLGTFFSNGYVIARAYMPYELGDTTYGLVEFNTKYLSQFTPKEIAGTVIHEIGHTLGIGWDKWMGMFDRITGRFPELCMYVETDYGPGTQYSHWDEEKYNAELMTGIQDEAEYLKPETIKVMALLGHAINECPAIDVPMSQILADVEQVQFTRQGAVGLLNLDHFKRTELMEERYVTGGRV